VENADGRRQAPHYTIACAVGGWPGLCLDNEDVRRHAAQFLAALVERYRKHPALGGYDVWNELNHNGDAGGCWCDASAVKFRKWLAEKYGDIQALNEAWYRYSYTSWDDVEIPRTNDPYPDSIDWALFRVDNAVRLFKWRVGIIRSLDDTHPITAHAIPMGALKSVGTASYPVFQAGKLVDIYGYSGGCNHEEWTKWRWHHWCKMDMTRSASHGKPFWAAEVPAGASWRMRGRTMENGRVVRPSDVRFYSLMNLAGGARGIFSPRWRPLQDGPVAGCFAFYGMDGLPTPNSRVAAEMARWANAPEQADLWDAKPVKGDIGILVVPESQVHCYAANDSTEFYYKAIGGAYQGFLFNNIQPDFVSIDDLGPQHGLLYLPYPVMLSSATAAAITAWVEQGGRLISEGCPAYHGNLGRIGTRQPNYALDQLFGAKQEDIQLTPDLLDELDVTMEAGYRVRGGIYLQSYLPTTGKAVGHFDDGRIAAVDNVFGRGRTRLIGTFPGYGYSNKQDGDMNRFFTDLLPWAGRTAHLSSSDNRVIARLHKSSKATYLWLVNSVRRAIETEITLSSAWGPFRNCQPVRGDKTSISAGRRIKVTVSDRDVLVLKLTG
jgi:beta-galactosidase